jgi:hypothetical protein
VFEGVELELAKEKVEGSAGIRTELRRCSCSCDLFGDEAGDDVREESMAGREGIWRDERRSRGSFVMGDP